MQCDIRDKMQAVLGAKVGEVRTVKLILDFMIETFAKTTGEEMLEMMREISGTGFKPEIK